MEYDFTSIAQNLGILLQKKKYYLATAESCTGGWVSQVITSIPGSSQWFDRGFVTYTNEAKQEMIQVPSATLDQFGAVSEETALAMAKGALNNSQAEVSLSITGIAGPEGGTQEKPIGTVWFAWCSKAGKTKTKCCHFSGIREEVRAQAVREALNGIKLLLLDS